MPDINGQPATAIHQPSGRALRIGIDDGHNNDPLTVRGGSTTSTISEQQTTGRGQAFRSVYEKLPTKEYSLEELTHLASVSIANLPQGVCLVKIGRRPVVRVKALRVKRRVISDEHLARVRSELFAKTPYALTREEAAELYRAFRAELQALLARRDGDEEA